MVSKSRPHNSSDRQGGHQRLGNPGYDSQKVQAEIRRIPEFLEAIGIKASEVCLTLYGGDGGNWHWQKVDGATHCRPVDINLIQEQILDWSIDGFHRQGHQLGFYPMFGGSTKAQSQGSPCLKVECDMLPKDQQLAVLRAFEHTYDVRFTIVDTGGKSLHAYLSIDEVITVERYQLVCHCFHQLLADVARMEGIKYEADDAVSRITQAMRLPGAIHRKTGAVATVLQLGKRCSLDQIECSPEHVDQFHKASTTRSAIAGTCQGGHVLGYEGHAATQILVSIAQAWEKRIPGATTYDKVLLLVANLTTALGVEKAAQLLYDTGHNDKNGEHNLQGLVAWCSSFTDPGDPAEATAQLISMAGSRYGWERPRASIAIVSNPSTEYINTEEELRAAIQGRSVLINCRTGKGKSKQTLGEARALYDESRRRNGCRSKFSAGVISPRRTINAQNAQLTGGRDVSTGRGELEDFYLACLKSWGLDNKRHGNPLLWRNGVMPAGGVLAIDEIRQVMEGVLLGNAGPGMFWESPAERVQAFARLVWSIRNAARFYGMDAQLGAPEVKFISYVRGVSRPLPVIGNPREENGGVLRWTNKQKTWKAALLQTIQDPDRTKPVLVVTGGKGDDRGDSTNGLSAWSLKRWIEAETAKEFCSPSLPEPVTLSLINIVVIDSVNKDDEEQRKILNDKDMGGAYVVIVTPVAQSGFSFIGNFHEVGFVAGGLTLPPNCVAQGARRERTLRTCYAYLPRTEIDRSCPFFTSDREENAQIVLKSMAEHGRDIDNLDPVEKLMIDTTLTYYERSITELVLFTDYALAYLHQDGWTLEALPDPEHAQKQQNQARKAAKDSKGQQLIEDQSKPVQLILKGLTGVLSVEEVADIERYANTGGLVDLVGANAAKVVDLLRRAGLHQLCDGKPRTKNDPEIVACGVFLQSPEAVTLLKQSNALDIRSSRSKDKSGNAVKAIGTVVKQLGGKWEPCGMGRRKVRGQLPKEEECC